MNSEMKEKKFYWKSFNSFGLLYSFIIMSLTGLVLYITPPGWIANWTTWILIGLDKEEWIWQR